MSESDRTVPYFKVRTETQKKAISNMITITDGDLEKLDSEIAKTAFKSLIGDGTSGISSVPRVVPGPYGPTLRIPIKDSPFPAFTSLEYLKIQFKEALGQASAA